MINFEQWVCESFTDNTEKVNQIARRIKANVIAMVNKVIDSNSADFKTFQKLAITRSGGVGFNDRSIYGWLTQRMSGYEKDTPESTKQINNMMSQMIEPSVNGAEYIRGSGWHHWVINGDISRGSKGTDKTYISVHYKSLIPNAQAVMTAVLKNLVSNGYRGQIKISGDAEDWLQRMDNFVLHSGSPEWAQFGANIVKKVLDHYNVKIGGSATTGNMEQGLDPKNTGTSFNGYISEIAADNIDSILKQTRDFDHFVKNIKIHFGENGPFVKGVLKIL
jgi:hypothetical protein